MPLALGMRIQNAYIARNTPEEEDSKKEISAEKFAEKEQEILRQHMPPEYFKGEWKNVGCRSK
jgi:hypothetical protein